MYIKHIELKNFRNYGTLSCDFGDGVNVFYGDNGQGKTNILESVFYCSIGRSFRYSRDPDLIRYGNEDFSIGIDVSDDITEKISITYSKNGEKTARVNGLYLRKLGHLMGSLLAVIFSPEDMDIVNGGPSVRRKLIDIVISQIHPSHYFDLQQYNKITANKNNLLRDQSKTGNSLDRLLSVYNEQLSSPAARIAIRRNKFSKELEKYASDRNMQISNGEKISFKYISNYFSWQDNGGTEDESEVKEAFFNLLESKLRKEKERYHSLYGPQYDDIGIELNGTDIRRFGSQGQKRTCVLAIKLAEVMLLRRATGREPVLLLDDVFSELDEKRCEMLLESIGGCQTFITTANIQELPSSVREKSKIFFIRNGLAELI